MSQCVTRSTMSKQKDKDKAGKENVDQDDVDKTADAAAVAAAATHQKELDDHQRNITQYLMPGQDVTMQSSGEQGR